MAAPKKLFLEWNDHDGQFHVNDKNGFAFGAGSYEPTDTIKSAHFITDAPIHIGETQSGLEELVVTKKPSGTMEDAESFIAMLAELSGMNVIKLFNDDMNFIGYTMEPIDEDLHDFLAAETATEQLESELVSAMGSYMEDE